jgi:Ni,Fe-hydrogenase III large subunit
LNERNTIDMQNLVKVNNQVETKRTIMKEIRRIESEIEEKQDSIQNIDNMGNVFNITHIREKLFKRV